MVSTKEFVEGVLVQTILPKNEPPLVLHDRVLSIIQVRRTNVSQTGLKRQPVLFLQRKVKEC